MRKVHSRHTECQLFLCTPNYIFDHTKTGGWYDICGKYITLAHQICGSRKSFEGNIITIMEHTDSKLGSSCRCLPELFRKGTPCYPMRWTSCCTTLYTWMPIGQPNLCSLQMQLRVITYQHLYLKGSMDIWEDPTEGVCQPWGSMAFVLWKPYRPKAPPVTAWMRWL